MLDSASTSWVVNWLVSLDIDEYRDGTTNRIQHDLHSIQFFITDVILGYITCITGSRNHYYVVVYI